MKAFEPFWTLIPWLPPSIVLFSIDAEFAFNIETAISEESPSIVLDLIITLLAKIAIALPSLSTRLLLSIVVRAPPEAILIPSCSLYLIVLLKIVVNIPWLKIAISELSLIVLSFIVLFADFVASLRIWIPYFPLPLITLCTILLFEDSVSTIPE